MAGYLKMKDIFQCFVIVLTILLLFPASSKSFAQNFCYIDGIYKSSIKTVRLHRVDQSLSNPVITFNSGEQLLLTFDDLDADYKNYRYTVIYCNADWTKSTLWQNEYVDGYGDGYIEDYTYSFNTVVPYTHYRLLIPNENLRLRLPGNYILAIYAGNDNDPLITRRFIVLDQRVTISGKIKIPVSGPFRHQQHEVGFTVNTGNLVIYDYQRNLQVYITQNGRCDNVLSLTPWMVRGNVLDFNYIDGPNVFEAGNEFRFLDIRSVRTLASGVREIERNVDGYQAYLWPDMPRNKKPYISEKDLNGRYEIISFDRSRGDIEADYVWVHFILNTEKPLDGSEVFIYGALTNWQLSGENRMRYDYQRKVYEKSLLLKQGYYNYMYAIRSEGADVANIGFFEGNHAATSNEYTVYVYYRFPGEQYDRLIGVQTFDSKDFY